MIGSPLIARFSSASASARAEVSLNMHQHQELRRCEALMRGGSKSFFSAARLLPQRVRSPSIALYAFCRVADDAIDADVIRAGGHQSECFDSGRPALAQLQRRLEAIYQGEPEPFDADRALAAIVHPFGIPKSLLQALLEGFEWDGQARVYQSINQLHDYCARVAGSVGAMMAILMGAVSREAIALACELGVAMQLTNIARDVGEDARAGRLYLPRDWMIEEGLDPDAWLERPIFNEALGRVIGRLLANADDLYGRAECGIAMLPWDCRPAILAARLVYAEIGREVERLGYDAVNHRAYVSQKRKMVLIGQALSSAVLSSPREVDAGRTLPAVGYLVDAGARPLYGIPDSKSSKASRPISERLPWVLELFERLAEREREARANLRERSDPQAEWRS